MSGDDAQQHVFRHGTAPFPLRYMFIRRKILLYPVTHVYIDTVHAYTPCIIVNYTFSCNPMLCMFTNISALLRACCAQSPSPHVLRSIPACGHQSEFYCLLHVFALLFLLYVRLVLPHHGMMPGEPQARPARSKTAPKHGSKSFLFLPFFLFFFSLSPTPSKNLPHLCWG
jgi:hypothetical protein